jgi:hypothetical protein
MLRSRRFQFGLRTLLVAMVVLGTAPWVAVQVVQWREDQLWNKLDTAKRLRNQALVDCRREYDIFIQGNVSAEAEAQARERYFSMRAIVETCRREIDAYYADNLDRKKAAASRRERIQRRTASR